MELTIGMPARQLVVEGLLSAASMGIDFRRVLRSKRFVLRQRKLALLSAQRVIAQREITTDLREFIVADFVEANLIEEAQQIGLGKRGRAAVAIPHLQSAADKLVTARPFHAVHAKIRAADTHRVFCGPGTRRIVFGGHQAVTRIDRRGDRRPQIHIAQTHHQIGSVEDDILDLGNAVETVDAADKFQITRAPGRIGTH